MSHPISCRVHYTGRVQGVGFRYSVKRIATGFAVVGWVRNLDDGRVELEATGEQNEVLSFVDAISKSHLGTHIRHVERVDLEAPSSEMKGFEIRT